MPNQTPAIPGVTYTPPVPYSYETRPPGNYTPAIPGVTYTPPVPYSYETHPANKPHPPSSGESTATPQTSPTEPSGQPSGPTPAQEQVAPPKQPVPLPDNSGVLIGKNVGAYSPSGGYEMGITANGEIVGRSFNPNFQYANPSDVSKAKEKVLEAQSNPPGQAKNLEQILLEAGSVPKKNLLTPTQGAPKIEAASKFYVQQEAPQKPEAPNDLLGFGKEAATGVYEAIAEGGPAFFKQTIPGSILQFEARAASSKNATRELKGVGYQAQSTLLGVVTIPQAALDIFTPGQPRKSAKALTMFAAPEALGFLGKGVAGLKVGEVTLAQEAGFRYEQTLNKVGKSTIGEVTPARITVNARPPVEFTSTFKPLEPAERYAIPTPKEVNLTPNPPRPLPKVEQYPTTTLEVRPSPARPAVASNPLFPESPGRLPMQGDYFTRLNPLAAKTVTDILDNKATGTLQVERTYATTLYAYEGLLPQPSQPLFTREPTALPKSYTPTGFRMDYQIRQTATGLPDLQAASPAKASAGLFESPERLFKYPQSPKFLAKVYRRPFNFYEKANPRLFEAKAAGRSTPLFEQNKPKMQAPADIVKTPLSKTFGPQTQVQVLKTKPPTPARPRPAVSTYTERLLSKRPESPAAVVLKRYYPQREVTTGPLDYTMPLPGFYEKTTTPSITDFRLDVGTGQGFGSGIRGGLIDDIMQRASNPLRINQKPRDNTGLLPRETPTQLPRSEITPRAAVTPAEAQVTLPRMATQTATLQLEKLKVKEEQPPEPPRFPRERTPGLALPGGVATILQTDNVPNKRRRVRGYLTLIRRYSLFRPVLNKPLPLEQAKALGIQKTKETLAATFRLQATSRFVEDTNLGKNMGGVLAREYTTPAKTSKLAAPLTFIQKVGTRLGTRAERLEIGRAARRAFKLRKKRSLWDI